MGLPLGPRLHPARRRSGAAGWRARAGGGRRGGDHAGRAARPCGAGAAGRRGGGPARRGAADSRRRAAAGSLALEELGSHANPQAVHDDRRRLRAADPCRSGEGRPAARHGRGGPRPPRGHRRGVNVPLVNWLWWSRRPSARIARGLLLPFAFLYRAVMVARAAACRRGWLRQHRLPLPAVAVGKLAGGAQMLVLDDAYQRLDVARDVDVALVSAENASAVAWPLPAGPWREDWGALARADVIVVTRRRGAPDDAPRLATRPPGAGAPAAGGGGES